jgi:hypothetical protein
VDTHTGRIADGIACAGGEPNVVENIVVDSDMALRVTGWLLDGDVVQSA